MTTRATRRTVLVGFGLGTVLAAGGAVALGSAGCSSSNNNNSGSSDGSADTSTMSDVSTDVQVGTNEAGADASDAAKEAAAPGLPAPKVFVVNASPDAPPLRLCIGVGKPADPTFTIASLPPLPDTASLGLPFPGLFPGTGGLLNSPVDISTLTLTVFAVNASSVAANTAAGGPDGGAELTCDQLIAVGDAGGGLLTAGKDYLAIGTLTAGAFTDGNSYVVAITGCAPGEEADAAIVNKCGTAYSRATGNLSLTTFALDSKTQIDAGSMGAQFAHASTAWDTYATSLSGFTGAGFFVLNPADGGGTPLAPYLAAPTTFGMISPMALQSYSGLTFDGTTGAFAAIGTSPTNVDFELALPFPIIEGLTYGASIPDGGAIQNGKGFVFVLVGDPTQPLTINPVDGGPEALDAGGSVNLEAAHLLVFPTSNP